MNDLEDKQTGIGYLETMMRYIFSIAHHLTETDVKQMIQQLESNHIKGMKSAMTLAKMWRRRHGRRFGKRNEIRENGSIV